MSKRGLAAPTFLFHIWLKVDNDHWRADVEKLKAIIAASGNTDAFMKSRMGHGYFHLAAALEGKPLNRWCIQLIEWGLVP